MSRADVIRQAMIRYHHREITLVQLLRILADWRR